MSVEVVVKVEPDLEYSDLNECDGALNSREPTASIKTEFVEIKVEPDFNESIKTEPPDSNGLAASSQSTEEHIGVQSVFIKIEKDEYDNEPQVLPEHDSRPPSPNTILPDLSDADLPVSHAVHIEKIEGVYPCPLCSKTFGTKANAQRHLTIHDRIIYKCSICTREFNNRKTYDKHIILHSLEKKYSCDRCIKKFRTAENLEQHRKCHTDVKQFLCDICERPFTIRGNMLKHRAKHNQRNTETMTCEICNKVFEKEYLLKTHLPRHTVEQPFSCEICLLKFKHKSTLMRHVQGHNGIMPFSCPVCLKRFTHKGLIKPHMKKHTGEKPFQCRMCKRLFAHKHNMLRHELGHSKVKNLVCHICNKAFPRESRLKYHMRSHTKEKLFSCDVCQRTFSHKQNVIRHYDRKHPLMEYKITKRESKVEEIE